MLSRAIGPALRYNKPASVMPVFADLRSIGEHWGVNQVAVHHLASRGWDWQQRHRKADPI